MWRNFDVCAKSSNTTCLTKESFERISFGSSGYIQNEIISELLHVLAENGPGAAKSPPVRTQLWPKTDIAWSRIHMDYAGPLNGYYYLVIVDSYSKWPEVFKYKHPTATKTIRALNEVFSRLGVPNTIVRDNGTMFTGSEFKVYYDSLAIEHITTPTYNPRSNGQAERFVDTFKRALKKPKGSTPRRKTFKLFWWFTE